MRVLHITRIEVQQIRGSHPGVLSGDQQRQVQAIDVYADERTPFRTPEAEVAHPDEMISYYMRIATEGDVEGLYGPIDRADGELAITVFGKLLLGQDALATSQLWDKMERLHRHARHGLLKMAISAVDNTLWDLKGRAYGAPVWQVLGGGSRPRIPAYASMLGTPLDEATVRVRSAAVQKEGYSGQKWFFEHGPGSGPGGLEASVRLVEVLRESVGPHEPLMFDAYHGWDLPFARAWAERVSGLHVTWLEETFLPNRHNGFRELHRSTGIPLATGEHVYDRQEAVDLLADGTLVTLQCDPEWCGGVTELTRICAVAETYGVPVIPHGHGVHSALHVVASQSPEVCPKAEYLMRIMPTRHHFELKPPTPRAGAFDLPTGPGFGIELDKAKISSTEIIAQIEA